MERRKILWLCSWYPNRLEPFNGDFIQRHARAAAMFNDIYVIHVAGDASGGTKAIEKQIDKEPGLTEHIVYYKKSLSLFGRVVSHFRWMWLYRQAVRRYMIENGKPDLVHVHVPFKAGLIAQWIKKRYKIPYVATEHWGIYNDIAEDNYETRGRFFKNIVRETMSSAAACISVSEYLAAGVNKCVLKKDFSIIPNVVNTELFHKKEKTGPVFLFIHVSNMVPLKNAEGILRAFKLFTRGGRKAELVMVGDTDSSIRQYAAELGLHSAVRFCGEISYRQVATEMQIADCLVLFSNIENSPCVIGEALCCGLPVIATAVGGIPELVNETQGLLTEPQNEKQLADAMQTMIDKYHQFDKNKIAKEAEARFSYKVAGQQLAAVYETTLNRL